MAAAGLVVVVAVWVRVAAEVVGMVEVAALGECEPAEQVDTMAAAVWVEALVGAERAEAGSVRAAAEGEAVMMAVVGVAWVA